MKRALPRLERVPLDLRLSLRWVVWGYEEREGKPTKVPYAPALPRRRASVRDPRTWGSLEEALEVASRAPWAAGVGLVLGEGLVGVDLDGALDGEGRPLPWAAEILGATATYAEVSPSGKGLHLLVYGGVSSFRRGAVEVYGEGRYFTFTGEVLPGRERPLYDPPFLRWLEGRFRGGREEPSPRPPPLRRGEGGEYEERILRSRYAPLWHGDWRSMGYRSQSEADLALAGYLLFITGGDLEEADALFRKSGLYRPKWDERRGDLTYGQRTLRRAMR